MRTTAAAALAAAVLLAACSEKPQDMAHSKRKSDVPAWQGANNAYVEPGWKVGDAASWEKQVNTRAQAQNEYARINAGAR